MNEAEEKTRLLVVEYKRTDVNAESVAAAVQLSPNQM